MAQSLSEAALRDVLTKAGLVAETIRATGCSPELPSFKVEIDTRRIAFDQLHMLAVAFDTWMIAVEADHGHEAGLFLAIAQHGR